MLIIQGRPTPRQVAVSPPARAPHGSSPLKAAASWMAGGFLERFRSWRCMPDFHIPQALVENEVVVVEEAVEEVVEDAIVLELVELQRTAAGAGKDNPTSSRLPWCVSLILYSLASKGAILVQKNIIALFCA
jgi:hypothetical protein